MKIIDCSTVFSIVPFEINQTKPGIYPGSFNIPACLDESNPIRLLIDKPANHLMMVGGKLEPVVIPVPSYQLAESVVNDFISEQIYASTECKPGITWMQGDILVSDFIKNQSQLHYEMIEMQKKWFLKIIEETDIDWNKFHNPRVAGTVAKFAARKLGLDKEWAKDQVKGLEWVKCPACRQLVDPESVVCSNCKCIVDPIKYKELQFVNA